MRYLRYARYAAFFLLFGSMPALAVTDVNVHITSRGESLPGATVTLLDSTGSQVVASEEDDDGDGTVVFPGIAQGDYRVSVHTPDGATNSVSLRVPESGAVTVGVPFAPLLSYNYLEADYIADFEFDDGGNLGLNDTAQGYWLRGSAAIGRFGFVGAQALQLDVNNPSPTGIDQSVDWLSLGPGVHLPFGIAGHPLDIWGQFSYDRTSFGGMPFTGYGGAGGLRFGFCDRLEFNTWYRYASTETDDNDLELTPQLYGAGLVYRITPALSMTASYAEGELELKNKVSDMTDKSDFNLLSLGMRLEYGGGHPASRAPLNADSASPVSYDYLQGVFVYAGEFEDPMGDSLDIDQGVGMSASRQFTDHAFLAGSAWTLDVDQSSGGGQTQVDMYSLGPGLRFGQPLGATWLDAYGQVSLDRVTMGGDVLDGFGGKLGLRWRPARVFEADLWGKLSYTDNGDDNLQTQMIGVSGLAYLCDRVALEFGYTMGDGDLEFGGNTDDVDLAYPFVGFRYFYGDRIRF